MSTWYKADSDNIDINPESSEVNICVDYNDWGNFYLTLTFEQIQEITNRINDLPPKE